MHGQMLIILMLAGYLSVSLPALRPVIHFTKSPVIGAAALSHDRPTNNMVPCCTDLGRHY